MVAPGRQKIRSAGGRQVLCSCDRIGPRRFLIHECWFKSCRAASPTDGGGSDQLQLCSGGGKKKTPSPSSLGRLFRRPAARGPVAAAAATKSYLYEAACSSESGLPDNGPAVCQWADCDKHFAVRTELIQHVHRQHCLHKAPYACRWAVCQRAGRPFAARYMFAAHMRMHTGERPYKCSKDGCGKAYSQYENLKTHLRGHSGEKPYNCKYCGKAFSNASDRAKHQNHTHIRDRMFECTQPDCDKKYTERSSLRKHLRTAHFIVKRQTDRQSVIRRGGASIMNVELASTSSSPTDLGANGELSVADLSGAEKLP